MHNSMYILSSVRVSEVLWEVVCFFCLNLTYVPSRLHPLLFTLSLTYVARFMRNFVLLLTFLFVGKTGQSPNAKGNIILKPYLSPSVKGLATFRVYNFLILLNLTSADFRYLAVIHEILHLVHYEPTKYHCTFRENILNSCALERKKQYPLF